MMKQTGRPPLYCPPPDKSFDGDEYVAMLREFVQAPGREKEAGLPVGFALLLTLGKKFPCGK